MKKRKTKPIFYLLFSIFLIFSCSNPNADDKRKIPVVGFLDFIKDPTIELARKGFFDALNDKGFSEKDSTIEVIYANAQGDIPALNQACDYILSKKPDLVGTNVTLSTITVAQRTITVPIFMMVSPRPDIAGLEKDGKYPANLYGVYETLDYIDSAVVIIKELLPSTKRIGTVYNQAEPQSEDAYQVLLRKSRELGMEVISLPVNNSSETQLVIQALLAKDIDVFFALPDNVIFASFETVSQSCNNASVPIFTSEAGLVTRGALASFGADFYQWGYQSGKQAAAFLKTKDKSKLVPQIVEVRRKIYNAGMAEKYGIQPDSTFSSYNP